MELQKPLTLFEEAVEAQSGNFTLDQIKDYVLSHNGMWNDWMGIQFLFRQVEKGSLIAYYDEKAHWFFHDTKTIADELMLDSEDENESNDELPLIVEELIEFIPMNVVGGKTQKERLIQNRNARAQRRRLGLPPTERGLEDMLRRNKRKTEKCIS